MEWPPRFVLWCYLKADADDGADRPDQVLTDDLARPLEEQMDRLIAGGRYKTLYLYGGDQPGDYDTLRRYPLPSA